MQSQFKKKKKKKKKKKTTIKTFLNNKQVNKETLTQVLFLTQVVEEY